MLIRHNTEDIVRLIRAKQNFPQNIHFNNEKINRKILRKTDKILFLLFYYYI
jgi:hypothetical protein